MYPGGSGVAVGALVAVAGAGVAVQMIGVCVAGTAVAVQMTGVPGPAWKKIDEGSNVAGWRWWRTYEVTGNGKVLLAVLGNGPKGSYVLFLGTTAADMAANRAQYREWYNKLTVF